MGETEQEYGKEEEDQEGNVICHKGDQQAYKWQADCNGTCAQM